MGKKRQISSGIGLALLFVLFVCILIGGVAGAASLISFLYESKHENGQLCIDFSTERLDLAKTTVVFLWLVIGLFIGTGIYFMRHFKQRVFKFFTGLNDRATGFVSSFGIILLIVAVFLIVGVTYLTKFIFGAKYNESIGEYCAKATRTEEDLMKATCYVFFPSISMFGLMLS